MRVRPAHLREPYAPQQQMVAPPKQRASAGERRSEAKAPQAPGEADEVIAKTTQAPGEAEQGPARQLREAKKSKERLDYIEGKRKLSGHEVNMRLFINDEIERLQTLVYQAKTTERSLVDGVVDGSLWTMVCSDSTSATSSQRSS